MHIDPRALVVFTPPDATPDEVLGDVTYLLDAAELTTDVRCLHLPGEPCDD